VYPPNTEEFEPLRAARARFLFETVNKNLSEDRLRKGHGFRRILGKPLTPTQLKYFSDALETLTSELMDLPTEREDPSETVDCWFVASLGPETVASRRNTNEGKLPQGDWVLRHQMRQ